MKKKWAGKMAFIGNVPTALLAYGGEEDIQDKVREYCVGLGPGGGYVLGSSTSIEAGIPPENFVAMIQAVLPDMRERGSGQIVNIASVVGATGNAGQGNYAAAKAGIVGFSKSLAREIGSRGITVNAVAPGFIDTDMTRELPDTQREALLSSIPLARLGKPEEIANTVAWLASEENAYTTGANIPVNGGLFTSH